MSPGNTVARMHARDWHFIYFRQRRVICDEGGCKNFEWGYRNKTFKCMHVHAGIAFNARPNPCMTAALF